MFKKREKQQTFWLSNGQCNDKDKEDDNDKDKKDIYKDKKDNDKDKEDKQNRTSFVKPRSGGGPVKCGLKGRKICPLIRFRPRRCQLTKRSRPMRINVPISAMWKG